jgi:hypothetical protein
VEQNSSGEDEVPDEDDEMPSQPYVPLYAVYKGMVSAHQIGDNHFMNSSTITDTANAKKDLPSPLVAKVDISSEPITPHESPNMQTSRVAEDAHQHRGAGLKAQREDLLMELVEFALEMDARKPRRQETNPLVRCSSETVIPQATPAADRGTLRRTLSTTERQTLGIQHDTPI